MQSAGYAQYRNVTTQTASPGVLLLQLYQAAIRNSGQAQLAINKGDIAGAHAHCIRVQEIVAELQRTLDFERGGEIAEQLNTLYTYIRQQLVAANIHKDVVPLAEVQGLLRQLLSAWQIAVRESSQPAPVQAAQPAALPIRALAG